MEFDMQDVVKEVEETVSLWGGTTEKQSKKERDNKMQVGKVFFILVDMLVLVSFYPSKSKMV